jgi:hypothetical protein
MTDNLPDGLKVDDAVEEFKFQINNYDSDFVLAFLLDNRSIYSDIISKKQRRLKLRDKKKNI